MKFLLDENVDIRLAAHLTQLGHDVLAVARDLPRSLDDPDILARARTDQRILITNDLDFGEFIVRHRLPHTGVILFRLASTDLPTKIARLSAVLTGHSGATRLVPSQEGSWAKRMLFATLAPSGQAPIH